MSCVMICRVLLGFFKVIGPFAVTVLLAMDLAANPSPL